MGSETEVPTLNGEELTDVESVEKALSEMRLDHVSGVLTPRNGAEILHIHSHRDGFRYLDELEQAHESESKVIITNKRTQKMAGKPRLSIKVEEE